MVRKENMKVMMNTMMDKMIKKKMNEKIFQSNLKMHNLIMNN